MIQLSAPTISANAVKPNGTAPSTSPKGAEIADFAALLGAAGSVGEMPEGSGPDMAAVLSAALAGLPDGKTGKVAGKTLPVADLAAADVAGSGLAAIGDLETNEAPDEAISDQADVPIAAALPVLPLLVPPLPGTGTPAEFRAAGPDTAPARAAVLPGVLPEQARPAAAKPVALLAEATVAKPSAPPAGMPPAAQFVVEMATVRTAPSEAAPADLGGARLAPVFTTAVAAQTEDNAREVVATRIAAQTMTVKSVVPTAAPAAETPVYEQPAAVQATLGGTPAATVAPAAPAAAAQVTAPLVAGTSARPAAKGKETEPQVAAASKTAKDLPVDDGGELDGAALAMRSAAHHVSPLSIAQPDTSVRIANAVPAATSIPAAAEQPHDFATLVDRLSEAREAASPQVVRTALQHAEFGRISLQFRHDDANLSVTMANADPTFTSAVQGAVAATLAGNAAGNGDQPQSDRQQPQQAQTASQQQSATSGNGGQGQQHAAQARAEQGERGFQRSQGSSARSQQGDTASSDHAATGARRSGIYA